MDLSQYSDEELMALAGQSDQSSVSSMSDQELMAIAGIEQEPLYGGGGVSNLRAALAGAGDTATFGFGDELKGLVQGQIRGALDPNVTRQEATDFFINKARQEAEQLQAENRYMYGAGQVAGAFVPVGGAASTATGLGKYARAAGIGGVSGGLYGAGTSEGGIAERATEAIPYGLVGAAGGAGLVGAASVGGRVLSPLTEKAARVYSKKTGNLPATQNLQQPMQKGRAVDLTMGQAMQDPRLQSLEKAALKGGLGDTAQDVALQAQAKQQGQIRGALEQYAPSEEALGTAASAVRGSFKSIKAKVNKAYEDARITQSVYINKEPLQEVFKPQVKAMLREGGYDLTDMSPRAQKIIKQVTDTPPENVTAYNLEKMEFWRRKASNAANDAYSSGNKSEGAALKEIVNMYDNFMGKLPDHALMSGDASAIEAINKARKLRRTQGVLFERNKIVKNLVENNNLTNEELANMVLTGSSRAEKINKGAGAVVKNMKKTIPQEKQPEFLSNLKRGTMARILKNSEGTELIEGNPMIAPNKLVKELDNIINNKTFMNELFLPEEQQMLKALREDVYKINSVRAGADNYSNTAYTLMRFLDSIPWGGGGLASAGSQFVAKPMAQQGARKELNKTLAPLMGNLTKELSGTAQYYGARSGGELAATQAE